MKKKIGALYIVLLHLLIALILLSPDLPNRIYLKLGILKPSGIEMAAHYRKMSLYHSVIDENVPAGAVIFIGDSHIQMLSVSAVTDKSVNYGISGDTTHGILNRLPAYQSVKRSHAVVIAAGHNDIEQNVEAEEIIMNYKRIIGGIPDNIPILFNPVLPIDERVGTRFAGMNSRIKSLNKSSRRLCGEFPNCYFLNFGEQLVDETGNLSINYHNGQGIHLNASGYSLWISYIKGALHKFTGDLTSN